MGGLKIGIDIGGTTIKGGSICKDKLVEEYSLPTMGNVGRDAILNNVFAVIDKLWSKEVELVGISSAGNINNKLGICTYATDNLRGWTGLNIKQTMEDRYGVPCLVDNDAVCALKGELKFYPELTDVVMLTFGTGLGGACLANGQILRGKDFAAARLGHCCLVPDGIECNCGKRGCAEQYLSATALLKKGQKTIAELSGCKQLFQLYRQGNAQAKQVIDEFGFYLNIMLDNIREIFSPQKIILGGGVATSQDVFLQIVKNSSDIAFAQLGSLAGVFGSLIEK